MSNRLSECYFANKGSTAVLCSLSSHQQQQQQPQQQPRRKRHHHNSPHPHRHQSLSAPASSRLSAGEDEMQTRANDIQAHLQSMFHILRPDDSLNMVSWYAGPRQIKYLFIGIYYCLKNEQSLYISNFVLEKCIFLNLDNDCSIAKWLITYIV